MIDAPKKAVYRHIPLTGLSPDELLAISQRMKLSLSKEDMLAVKAIFAEEKREPTEVELEVIAQTWSEHCKHRIFGAKIEHTVDGKSEVVDGLFKTYIRAVSHRIMDKKPDFVLSAFVDNAGFVKLDENLAVCLKAETHNHPSAIEPYAGANTGLGGVIRDILGAGKGAKPIASLDVFCFGPPDTKQDAIKAKDVIHPLGIMRGVVRGVRDYGNRMGIPTISGAIQFDDSYIYNPLVFCGTMGVIPIKDIDKSIRAGQLLIAAGGRTGKDGLKGATFSSVSLTTASHEEDQTAVQIGNPIEEKKVADFILAARAEGFIQFVTDCGAGGFSSAAGEMLSEIGGQVWLENAPLKAPDLESWQIFLSESQERMVMSIEEKDLERMKELAALYETELCILGKADGTGILKVTHHGEMVCQLDCRKLHEAPRRHMTAEWSSVDDSEGDVFIPIEDAKTGNAILKALLADFAIVSREPIIREYDHEVQGNTLLKPLAGATGDAPQDGAVVRVDGSTQLASMSVALLPEWGKTHPHLMGRACVDECVRQLVAVGSDPDRIAILDNFCMGNPDDHRELGALVETVKGMAVTAEAYGAPFVSGKDSFYNYFKTDEGPVSIPCTLLVSGMGILTNPDHIVGSSVRGPGHKLALVGEASSGLAGSVFARVMKAGAEDDELDFPQGPDFDEQMAFADYHSYHELVKKGVVLSAHDIGEGGLAVTLAEMGFSTKAGLKVDLAEVPTRDDTPAAEHLFGETPGRIVFEFAEEHAEAVKAAGFSIIGETTDDGHVTITNGKTKLVHANLAELKPVWQKGLAEWY
ncbi:MAG: phosphoribosylformylglycinamidine synthase subunit PurL [Verrucomicrobiaceae bacterium]|nr:phosphoribosylformylglycinamidine synthase subunit PurL [Verrucomicrobiaceae bacterium]